MSCLSQGLSSGHFLSQYHRSTSTLSENLYYYLVLKYPLVKKLCFSPQKTRNAAGGKIEQVILDSSFILLLSQSQGTYLDVSTSCTFIVHLFVCVGVGRTTQSLLEQQSGESPHCTSTTMCLPFILLIWSFSQILD